MNMVKKFVCGLLVCSLLLFGSSCSGYSNGDSKKTEEAFDSAKIAYTNLSTAYEKIDAIGSDIYEAWRFGIYEDGSITMSNLSNCTNLSYEEINAAADSLAYPGVGHSIFYLFGDSKFSACIALVEEAYHLNGSFDEIEELLNNAKTEMKTMSEEYSDYEHYSNLKEMYSVVNSYFEFCKETTGTFEQLQTTLNDYRNDVRDLKSDLGYIFEDL